MLLVPSAEFFMQILDYNISLRGANWRGATDANESVRSYPAGGC